MCQKMANMKYIETVPAEVTPGENVSPEVPDTTGEGKVPTFYLSICYLFQIMH
jgi:hypothetical protein